MDLSRKLSVSVDNLTSSLTRASFAAGLNAQNIPTARGGDEWTATQVSRVLERL